MTRRWLRSTYGAGPLHLLVTLASLALAGYAFTRIFQGAGARSVALWFVGAIVAHDLIALPLYSALDRVAQGASRRARARPRDVPAVNHLRVPTLLSGLTLVVYFPLILGLSAERYQSQAGASADVYLGRWLLITAGLFAVSALAYAIRIRARRRRPSRM